MTAPDGTSPSHFEHVWEPADGGGPDATLLLLHGTGGSEHDMLPLGRQLAPGAALLSPRGKVLEGGVSTRFFRRHAEGHLDIPDLLGRTDELAAFVAESARGYGFDPSRVIAVGFSNGANIAASLLFRHPATLSAAALLRPMLPYEPDPDLNLDGKSVLVAAGAQDPLIPTDQSRELARRLEAAGASVSMQLDETAGHGLVQQDLVSLAAWLEGLLRSP